MRYLIQVVTIPKETIESGQAAVITIPDGYELMLMHPLLINEAIRLVTASVEISKVMPVKGVVRS